MPLSTVVELSGCTGPNAKSLSMTGKQAPFVLLMMQFYNCTILFSGNPIVSCEKGKQKQSW